MKKSANFITSTKDQHSRTKCLPKDKTYCLSIENKARPLAVGLPSIGLKQFYAWTFELNGFQCVKVDMMSLFLWLEDKDTLLWEHC